MLFCLCFWSCSLWTPRSQGRAPSWVHTSKNICLWKNCSCWTHGFYWESLWVRAKSQSSHTHRPPRDLWSPHKCSTQGRLWFNSRQRLFLPEGTQEQKTMGCSALILSLSLPVHFTSKDRPETVISLSQGNAYKQRGPNQKQQEVTWFCVWHGPPLWILN